MNPSALDGGDKARASHPRHGDGRGRPAGETAAPRGGRPPEPARPEPLNSDLDGEFIEQVRGVLGLREADLVERVGRLVDVALVDARLGVPRRLAVAAVELVVRRVGVDGVGGIAARGRPATGGQSEVEPIAHRSRHTHTLTRTATAHQVEIEREPLRFKVGRVRDRARHDVERKPERRRLRGERRGIDRVRRDPRLVRRLLFWLRRRDRRVRRVKVDRRGGCHPRGRRRRGERTMPEKPKAVRLVSNKRGACEHQARCDAMLSHANSVLHREASPLHRQVHSK